MGPHARTAADQEREDLIQQTIALSGDKAVLEERLRVAKHMEAYYKARADLLVKITSIASSIGDTDSEQAKAETFEEIWNELVNFENVR